MKKIIFILGLLLTTGFAASQFFLSSPRGEPTLVSVSAPEPMAQAPELSHAEESEIPPMPTAKAQSLAAPAVNEKPRRTPAAVSEEENLPREKELPPAISQKAAAEAIEPVEQEREPVTLASKPIENPDTADTQDEESLESTAADPKDQEPELFFQPHVGYGVKYIKLKQGGAFGGGDGGVDLASGPSAGVNLKYGEWGFAAAYENLSVNFPTDSAANSKEKKDFKTLSLKGGYGIFFLGAKARTAPLVRAGATALTWADVTTVDALGGLRVEKLYAGRRRRPFLLRGELEGSIPLSASANGGPAISKASGFGLSLKGYAEKAFVSGETFQLKFGLEVSAAYEQTKVEGVWSGSSGTATRTIQEYGSKAYLGWEF
jgi:hypothetical protein